MRKYRDIIAVLLLLTICIPVFTIVKMQFQLFSCELAAPERLQEKNLVTITVSLSDMHWANSLHEVNINGFLFDVKNYEITTNGAYKLTGVFDPEETEIENRMSDLLSHESEDGNIFLKDFFSVESIQPKQPFFSFIQFLSAQKLNKSFFLFNLSCGIKEVLTPPPNTPCS